MTEWMGISAMKINNLGYLCKEGIRGIFLHGFMSFAAVCVTVACLLIVGTFSALTHNLSIIVDDLNKTNEVMVYIEETLSDAEARSVGTKINRVDNIATAEFVSREQALANFIEDHSETDAFEGTSADTFRHRFKVVMKDPSLLAETKEALSSVPGVVKVKASEELAAGFLMLQNVIELVSMVIIIVLLIVSLLIISNTVKLAMYDRKDQIGIMKIVGATNSFIRLPFVVQGFTLGILGAAIAFALEWAMYNALLNQIAIVDTFGFFALASFEVLLPRMVLIFISAGAFVGVVGSWTSIRKFMNV